MIRLAPWILLVLHAASDASWSGEFTAVPTEGTAWHVLPVLDGGRCQPLATLARETSQELFGRASVADPATGQRLDPVALYLTMMLDWQGWRRPVEPLSPQATHASSCYFQLHAPDRWDLAPLFPVNSRELRRELELVPGEDRISAGQLSQATVRLPLSTERKPFLRWAESLADRPLEELTGFERQSLELAIRFWSYQDHRLGKRLRLVPDITGSNGDWMTLAELWRGEFDGGSDAARRCRDVKRTFGQLLAARDAGDAAEFQEASAAFLAALHPARHVSQLPADEARVAWEAASRRWPVIRFAGWLMLLAFAALVGERVLSGSAPLRLAGYLGSVVGLLLLLAGLGMRWWIAGRFPLATAYESLVASACGVSVIGWLLGWRSGNRDVLLAASAVAAALLAFAGQVPGESFRLLPAELRNNPWLAAQLCTTSLAFAAFALGLALGNVTLTRFLINCSAGTRNAAPARVTCTAIELGVMLLAAGILLGSAESDLTWGSFWDWRPSECACLTAVLGYLGVLHAHRCGRLGTQALAALAVSGFVLAGTAWYAVLFAPGGISSGATPTVAGQHCLVSAAVVQFAFLAMAGWRMAQHVGDSPAARAHLCPSSSLVRVD